MASGNLWIGCGTGPEGLDRVDVFTSESRLIGRIGLPARCANLCFGGPQRNRLFMCGRTAVSSLSVTTPGVPYV